MQKETLPKDEDFSVLSLSELLVHNVGSGFYVKVMESQMPWL